MGDYGWVSLGCGGEETEASVGPRSFPGGRRWWQPLVLTAHAGVSSGLWGSLSKIKTVRLASPPQRAEAHLNLAESQMILTFSSHLKQMLKAVESIPAVLTAPVSFFGGDLHQSLYYYFSTQHLVSKTWTRNSIYVKSKAPVLQWMLLGLCFWGQDFILVLVSMKATWASSAWQECSLTSEHHMWQLLKRAVDQQPSWLNGLKQVYKLCP